MAQRWYIAAKTRWLHCVECPQYSIRLKALGCLCATVSVGVVWWHHQARPLRQSEVPSTGVKLSQKIWWRFLVRSVQAVNDFELISTVKMETRYPVEDHLVINFRRSIIIAELWRPEVAIRWKNEFVKFCRKMIPYGKIFKILLRKDSLQHRSTCCVQISWNLADGNR